MLSSWRLMVEMCSWMECWSPVYQLLARVNERPWKRKIEKQEAIEGIEIYMDENKKNRFILMLQSRTDDRLDPRSL